MGRKGGRMKDFVIETKSEPPKFYVDEVEKVRVVEFVSYKTVIRADQPESE